MSLCHRHGLTLLTKGQVGESTKRRLAKRHFGKMTWRQKSVGVVCRRPSAVGRRTMATERDKIWQKIVIKLQKLRKKILATKKKKKNVSFLLSSLYPYLFLHFILHLLLSNHIQELRHWDAPESSNEMLEPIV
jgi:hypothetical protein